MEVRVTLRALENFRRMLIRFSTSIGKESIRTRHLLHRIHGSLEHKQQELRYNIQLCEEEVENARGDEEDEERYYRALRALDEARNRQTEFDRLFIDYCNSAQNCIRQFNRQEIMSDDREKVKANINKKIDVLSHYLGAISIANRFRWAPVNEGGWSGTRGRSLWRSQNATVRRVLNEYGLDGIRYVNGFPDFTPVIKFEANLRPDLYLDYDYNHFNECNSQLTEAVANNPELARRFTSRQIQSISMGRTPDRLVWHHHQEAGRMQLVPLAIHRNCGHVGGMSIWGRGY